MRGPGWRAASERWRWTPHLELVVLGVTDVGHVRDGDVVAGVPLALQHQAAAAEQLQVVARHGEGAQAAVHQVHTRVQAGGREPGRAHVTVG